MSDIKLTHGEIQTAEKRPPEFGWRQATLGTGVFLLIVALFISAGAKGALGRLPAYVAFLAIMLIAVPVVAGIYEWLSSKIGSGKDTAKVVAQGVHRPEAAVREVRGKHETVQVELEQGGHR